jgi:SAM-dependent methyltransferase
MSKHSDDVFATPARDGCGVVGSGASTNQEYLLTRQYNNADKLNARIELHRRFSTNNFPWSRWVFDSLDKSGSYIPVQGQAQGPLITTSSPIAPTFLEVGCGPATFWLNNLARIPADWDITLSDFSPGMVQEAQQNLRESNRAFEFAVFDVQSIPFEDAHFDAVIANHMLYHVPDRAKALGEIRRVLKPGGRFYAATNGENHMRELDELLKKCDPTIMSRWKFGASQMTFRLEKGGDELAHWFSNVKLHRYESNLVVTEAEPLVAYVLSMFVNTMITGEKISQFRSLVEQEIAAHSAIFITKDTGLFEAF